MNDTSGLPKFLIAYRSDHRLAYTDANVRNSLRGVYDRYGQQAIDVTAVYSMPGYEDVTSRFIVGEANELAPF